MMIIIFVLCWIFLIFTADIAKEQNMAYDENKTFKESLIISIALTFGFLPTGFYLYFRIMQIYHVVNLYLNMKAKGKQISFSSFRTLSLLVNNLFQINNS